MTLLMRFELRLVGAWGPCGKAGAPPKREDGRASTATSGMLVSVMAVSMPSSGRQARDADPAEPWARGPLARRSFRDRRIPTRPDVRPGGAFPVGGPRMLRSRRLGQVPPADSVMDRRRNHLGRSGRLARRETRYGPMDWRNGEKGPISPLFGSDRMSKRFRLAKGITGPV